MQSYLLAAYWTVTTMTSTGYGDIHAVAVGEKWLASTVMLGGTKMGVAL